LTTTQKPSIILLDIETSPITAYTWGTFDQNVLKVLEPSKIMSVAWKELYAEEVQVRSIFDYSGYKPGIIDDKKLVADVWKVLDRADIVIAHHGDAFDLKKLNSRFIFHGLCAPSAYKTIDTKKVASKYFKFDSNALNNLGVYLKLGEKVANGGFGLWVKCIAGDPEAWDLMKRYNQQDVALLEKVYLKLRPFMENHPNLSIITNNSEGTSCPSCSSTNVTKRGFTVTKTSRRQRFQCGDCGSWSSGPYEKAKAVLT
jgi:hypothetical protein